MKPICFCYFFYFSLLSLHFFWFIFFSSFLFFYLIFVIAVFSLSSSFCLVLVSFSSQFFDSYVTREIKREWEWHIYIYIYLYTHKRFIDDKMKKMNQSWCLSFLSLIFFNHENSRIHHADDDGHQILIYYLLVYFIVDFIYI